MEKKQVFLAALFALASLSCALAQDAKTAVDAQSLELKKLQLQEVKSGKIKIEDTYTLKEMNLENKTRFGIKVSQIKSVPNTQSCGVLGDRHVVLYGSREDDKIKITQAQFEEFVSVKNYLMKFEENWENLKDKKTKDITYNFDVIKENNGQLSSEKLRLTGTRGGLEMMVVSRPPQPVKIFASKNLKEIADFSQLIDFTANFLNTYNFAECL